MLPRRHIGLKFYFQAFNSSASFLQPSHVRMTAGGGAKGDAALDVMGFLWPGFGYEAVGKDSNGGGLQNAAASSTRRSHLGAIKTSDILSSGLLGCIQGLSTAGRDKI